MASVCLEPNNYISTVPTTRPSGIHSGSPIPYLDHSTSSLLQEFQSLAGDLASFSAIKILPIENPLSETLSELPTDPLHPERVMSMVIELMFLQIRFLQIDVQVLLVPLQDPSDRHEQVLSGNGALLEKFEKLVRHLRRACEDIAGVVCEDTRVRMLADRFCELQDPWVWYAKRMHPNLDNVVEQIRQLRIECREMWRRMDVEEEKKKKEEEEEEDMEKRNGVNRDKGKTGKSEIKECEVAEGDWEMVKTLEGMSIGKQKEKEKGTGDVNEEEDD